MVQLILVVIQLIRFVFGVFIKPVIQLGYKIYYRNIDQPRPLPKIKNPILLLPANKLAVKIRNRHVLISLYK